MKENIKKQQGSRTYFGCVGVAAQADVYFEMEAERILEESCSKRREEAKQPTSQMRGSRGKESGTGQDSKVAENAMKMYTKISTNLFDSFSASRS